MCLSMILRCHFDSFIKWTIYICSFSEMTFFLWKAATAWRAVSVYSSVLPICWSDMFHCVSHVCRTSPCSSDECFWLGCLFISAVTKWNVSREGGGGVGYETTLRAPSQANWNGCLIYIAIRLAVFIHHFRLFITAVKNSMQWISCDIKSQFLLKAGTGSKLKDC